MIRVLFQTESHYPVATKKIKEAVVRALTGRIHSKAEVSVSIVGSRRMRLLNRTYRGKDYSTDVLSFGLSDPTEKGEFPFKDVPDGTLRLGDVVVSYPEARNAAAAENKFVDDKIIELITHGLDHLMGIHHEE